LLHVRTERGSSAVPEELRAYAAAENIDITDADLVQSVANRIVNVAEQRARSRGATAVEAVVEFGNPAKVILERAREAGVDLIVMGRRGLGALPGMLLGSVSGKILHLADCACLTVK
jgi:nucleotide-binding universal stress UspA family protein